MNEVRRGLWRLLAQGLHHSARALNQWAEHAAQRLHESNSVPPQSPAPTQEGVSAHQDRPPHHWLERVNQSQAPAHWLEYIASRAPHLLSGDAMLSYGNMPTEGDPLISALAQELSQQMPSQPKPEVMPQPSQPAQFASNRATNAHADPAPPRPQPARRVPTPLKLQPTPKASPPERADHAAPEPSSAPTSPMIHERHAQEEPAAPLPRNLDAQEWISRQATTPPPFSQELGQKSQQAKLTQVPSSPLSSSRPASNRPGVELANVDSKPSSVSKILASFPDAPQMKPSDVGVDAIQPQVTTPRSEHSDPQWPWQRMEKPRHSSQLQSNQNLPSVAYSAMTLEASQTKPVLRPQVEQSHPYPSLPRTRDMTQNQRSGQQTSKARRATAEDKTEDKVGYTEAQPLHSHWPELPEATLEVTAEEERSQRVAAQTEWREYQRRRRLDDEQKGRLWSA